MVLRIFDKINNQFFSTLSPTFSSVASGNDLEKAFKAFSLAVGTARETLLEEFDDLSP